MTILEKIIETKRQEVKFCKERISMTALEKHHYYARNCHSFVLSLSQPASTGIIAEFKRKSPSKGIINDRLSVQEVTSGYVKAGAVCLSVLTDQAYFGGSDADFEMARMTNVGIPMLRKDFMIDPYQIVESKAMGADVVLLIAAALSPVQIKNLGTLARSLGMETLLEVHDAEELDRSLGDYISVVGVNNRNLKNFSEQNVEASMRLADQIPKQFMKISESCISGPEVMRDLKKVGYRGFLIGESFMKTSNPGEALAAFLEHK